MPVIVMMGQDQVRREICFEILEGLLYQLALERQKAVAKPIDGDLARAGPG